MRSMLKLPLLAVVAVGVAGLQTSVSSPVRAAEGGAVQEGWSPTEPYPTQEVYYPGTEALGEEEIRIIACGSGMPMPRSKQAAACFLIELGNGEKLIFDLGTGSFTTLYALGIPLDYMTKIFISHQHADHMGDLPTMWIYGMQNGRSKPLEIWGPGGGGMPDGWGMKAATDGILKFYNWMLETSKGALDTRSLAMNVTEFDWSKVNNVIYDQDGVVIRTIPAIHLEGSVSFILEWKGMKIAFSGDTLANRWWTEYAKHADLAIHEAFLPNRSFVTRYKFQPGEAIYVSTLVHTTAAVFGKVMALTEPRRAVAYHFQNDPDTLPEVVTDVRKSYDGPVDFAVDGMVWNITKDEIRTRVAMLNSQPFPPASVTERQQAPPGGEVYETPDWVLQGYEWETLPLMDQIHDEFNEEFDTDFQFPLRPAE
ncbi:MAG: MBL fold metallo-hydrolase [Hyphomicrobiales bacterium]|nr:MBL fold metallo-hydrolase [Hyphomicrobiales bacterium]